MRQPDRVFPSPPRPGGRLAVTIAGVVLVQLAGYLPLPFVELTGLDIRPGGVPGVLALGLEPFATAFLAVELLALVWPRWRRLRVGGAAARAPLVRAALCAGIALAAVQAWGIVTFMASGRLLAEADARARAVVALTLVAGSAAVAWIAAWISRRGLGNGFAVLFSASALVALPRTIPMHAGPQLSGAPAILARALDVAVPIAGAVLVLHALLANPRRTPSGPRAPRLRDPASGVVPVSLAETLLVFPAALSGWFPPLSPLADALRPGTLHGVATFAAATFLAWQLPRVFHEPSRVAAVWSRIGGADAGSLQAAAAAALRDARVRAVALVGALLVLPLAASAFSSFGYVPGGALALAFACAAVADVVAEWRARAAAEDLVSVWPEQRLYAVDAALDALSAAGVRAFARNVHYRTLQQFFAPYAPVELLVPAADAAAADAILRRVLAGEAQEAPEARRADEARAR